MPHWPIEKVHACLERIVHQEFLPSQQEIVEFSDLKSFKNDQQLLEFLKFLYKNSKKLEIYGAPEELLEDIKKIDKIPHFIQFSSCAEVKVSGLCALLTPNIVYTEENGSIEYCSKRNILTNIYAHFAKMIKSQVTDELVDRFYSVWQIANLNKMLRDLKGSYDVIPLKFIEILKMDIKTVFEAENIGLPEEEIIFQCFSHFGEYFEPEEKGLFEQLMDSLKSQEILFEFQQDYYKTVFMTIEILIYETKKMFERHVQLFTPDSKLKPSTMSEKPVIRRIQGQYYHYYLAKEVENAVRILTKHRSSKFQIPKNLIVVESEDERKLGIVYTIQLTVFEKILKELNLIKRDFTILVDHFTHDYRDLSYPIISSYGTHCVPSLDAFNSIVHYLAVILKVFQRCNSKNIKNVFDWIENMMDSIFVKKPIKYLIEISKIEEIIDRARKELSIFLTEPEHEVTFQEVYTKNDILRDFEKYSVNFSRRIGRHLFLALADLIIDEILKAPVNIKNIYNGYCQIVHYFLKEHLEKPSLFVPNQWNNSNQKIIEKYGLTPEKIAERIRIIIDNEKKQESSENAEIQKLREELKKCRKSEAQLQLKISQKSEAQLQEKLKIQESQAENAEIQKLQEELEKSQKSEAQLQEKLKIQESLKVKAESAEIQKLQKLQEELGKEREELKQKNEFLMSENGALRAENFKNTEFQLKIKNHVKLFENEHCGLVDSARSTLHRLCSRYPESEDVSETKDDVMRMEDCVDEYVKNVKKEYKKLRE